MKEQLLVDVSRLVGESLDADQAATDLARVLVPRLADTCLVVVMEPSGPRRVAWVAVDAESNTLTDSLRHAPVPSRARAVADAVMSARRAQLIPDLLVHLSADNTVEPDFEQLAPRATIVAPLVARGEAIGVLVLSMLRRTGRDFATKDTTIAEELGQLLGLAITNARLFSALADRNRQLSLAMATAPVRVFSLDSDLRYTLIEGTGYHSAAQVLGKTDLELLPLADAEPIIAIKRRVIETGVPTRDIIHVNTPTGMRYYDQTIEAVRDASGKIVGLAGASWEVTEQRQLNIKLAEAEAHARRLIEDAPEPYFLRDVHGRCIDINEAACQLFGYSRDELLAHFSGEGIEIVVATDMPRLATALAERQVGSVSVNEWKVRRKDGQLLDIEARVKILADGSQQGFMRDITDRKKAERTGVRLVELEKSHSKRLEMLRRSTLVISSIERLTADGVRSVLQRIVEEARVLSGADYAAIGIGTDPERPFDPWVWSGLSDEEATAIGATPRARGVLGWVARLGEPLRLSRLQEHPASGGVPAGHPPMQAFLGMPVVREGRPIGNLYLAKKPGREGFTPEDHAIVGLLSGHAAIAIENAQLYDERQAAVRVREELIAVVSHDLKSPLSAIELRATILSRTQTEPSVLAQAQSVRRAVAMMQRMIRGLLDGASLASGQFRLDVGAHDFRALVDDVVDLLTPIAKDLEVTLEVRIPEMPPLRFDRERLLQTIYNLAGNALKFTGAGGSVVIEAVHRDRELAVSVSDTGIGIAPDALPRIFDRYFTTAKGHEGTGLGLYIARGVILAHGGKIWVDSTLGVGSSFHFTLPTGS